MSSTNMGRPTPAGKPKPSATSRDTTPADARGARADRRNFSPAAGPEPRAADGTDVRQRRSPSWWRSRCRRRRPMPASTRPPAPLFAIADTPQKMLDLGEERLREFIKTIGLYNSKAKNVIALSERLVREFGGEVPRERAILRNSAGRRAKDRRRRGQQPLGRTRDRGRHPCVPGLEPPADRRQVRRRSRSKMGLMAVVPPEYVRHAHHWLILHGRYTCIARKPLCAVCVIADLCRWPEKTA